MPTSKAFEKVEGVPNLYHRGGRYYARVSINGKQTWRSLATGKIRAAKRALAELQTGRVSEVRKREEPTLHAALADTVAFRAVRRINKPLTPNTATFHQELLGFTQRMLPDRKLSSFSTEEILGALAATGVGESRRKAAFELVKGSYRRAIEAGQVSFNPLAGHVPPQVAPKDRQLPTREQLEAILEKVAEEFPRYGRRACLTIRLLAFSGMRKTEARELQWSDIKDGVMHIRGRKTVRSNRRLQINPPLQSALEDIGAIYGRDGGVMPTKDVRAQLKTACEALEIQPLTNHDLRAWFVTYALQSGVDVATVADWIGDSAEVVLRRYTAIMTSHKESAAQLLQ